LNSTYATLFPYPIFGVYRRKTVATLLKMEIESIDINTDLQKYGVDLMQYQIFRDYFTYQPLLENSTIQTFTEDLISISYTSI